MFTVHYDLTPNSRGGPTVTCTTRSQEFDTEEDARRFARSLHSDVWNYLGAVSITSAGRRIAASFDDDRPL